MGRGPGWPRQRCSSFGEGHPRLSPVGFVSHQFGNLSIERSLGNFSDIGVAVSKRLAAFSDQPDSIILVETERTPWYVWPLKDGASVHTSQDCIEIDPDELE